MVFGHQFVLDIDQIAKIRVPFITQFAVMPGRRDRAEADQGVAWGQVLKYQFLRILILNSDSGDITLNSAFCFFLRAGLLPP